MSALRTAPHVEEHLLKARAYGLCALWLSERTSESEAHDVAGELALVLDRLALADEADHMRSLSTAMDSERLRPFRRGGISPYETGHEAGTGSAGGVTFVLADIAGFYRAFGFEVAAERPDHVVAELEFMALLYAKEAYARASGEGEGAAVCAEARRKFMAEHLGAWLPQFSEKISEELPDSALSAVIRSVLDLAKT